MPLLSSARLVVAGLILGGLVLWIDPQAIALAMARADLSYLIGAAALIVLAGMIGGLNVWLLIRRATVIRLTRFLPVYWLAWAVGLVTPGQVGDVAVLATTLRREGLDWRTVTGRSIADKLVSALVMSAIGAIGLWRIGVSKITISHAPLNWALAATVLAVTLFVAWKLLPRRLRQSVRVHAAAIGREITLLARFQQQLLATNLILTLAKVALTGLAYWMVFRALHASIDVVDVLLLSTAAGLVAYLPISFNGLGAVEVTAVALFTTAGVPSSVVVAAYLALRFCVLAAAWIPASLIFVIRRTD